MFSVPAFKSFHKCICVQTSARADLEHAKLQLEEAQKREADQLRIIQMLERENRQWKQNQRQISDGIMSNSQCMADLNDIARNGSKSPRVLPSHQNPEVRIIACFTSSIVLVVLGVAMQLFDEPFLNLKIIITCALF